MDTMKQSYSVTSLQDSPHSERRARMVKYSVAMGVRLVCIAACFFVEGWWLLLPAAGAVFLPYFAVVVANSVAKKAGSRTPLRPGTLSVISRP
ncbi:MAG: hypothetical protein RL187_696 [Actinomycetota bacterium]